MLIFVYNADSGKLNLAFDIAHKLLSPKTYSCDLCQMTHGAFKEKQTWKKFREQSNTEMIFLHRDEFEAQYRQSFDYPIILKKESQNDSLEIFFSTHKINAIKSVDILIESISKKL